jgi:hypothetical protein
LENKSYQELMKAVMVKSHMPIHGSGVELSEPGKSSSGEKVLNKNAK